jgi:hypothetical protein
MKSKMVGTAGLSLAMDIMGNMFQNANLTEAWLYMNVHWIGPLQSLGFLFCYKIQDVSNGRT